MRRALAAALCATVALFGAVAPANAAAPVPGAVSATNLQGVSAVLVGSVDPGGLQTTYSFEYVDQAGFLAGGFAGAKATPAMPLQGSGPHPARAAIAGLAPSTTYRFRLRAKNAQGDVAGSPAAFATTEGFGFLAGEAGFAVRAIADGGATANLAGSHPYQLGFQLGLRFGGEFEGQPGVPFSDGDLRDLGIEMPPGTILNPAALPKCKLSEFRVPRTSPFEASASGESCPDDTQVGTVELATSRDGGQVRRFGVFNLEPPPGVPAQLGFAPFGSPVVLETELRERPGGSYVLALKAANLAQSLDLHGMDLVLWGNPWGVSHNGERGNCLNELEPTFPWAKCSVGPPPQFPPKAYVTLPAACDGPLAFTATAAAWQQPARASAQALSRQTGGEAPAMSCAFLGFAPHPAGALTTKNASTASGFSFKLANEAQGLIDPTPARAPSQVKRATLFLSEGVTINPSLGEGLGVCSPGQYAAETAFTVPGAACPNSSKIGELVVRTPLFSEWLQGSIYLARPDDPGTGSPGAENPFDSLIAIYLVAKAPGRGVQVRAAGKIAADPRTGRLTATFEGMPQLPYDDLEVTLRSGQRAGLISPPACGTHLTRIELVPWGGVVSAGSFSIDSGIEAGIGGGACPSGTPPFSPGAVAGGVNSNVGSYTPYFVHLTRKDTEQEITSYSLVLPKGITGKLAGVPFCSDAAIEAARHRRGTAETASPSCPAASQVGRTLTGYGVGPALTYAPGRIYLAGPYHGSPLSLVTINAATVGPFDLGTVVVRSAFDVDPVTAQLRIDSSASDPIPHILDGIPLHLRDIRIYIDRPEFTRNPTSCEPSELVSTLTGAGARFDDPRDDSTASASVRFQLLNCLTLGFQPKLGLRLRGGSRRGQYPSMRATFAARDGRDANLKRIAVTMPHALFLAQNHIRTVCTRAQFAADRCPAGSVYGHAVAHTPLFDGPLRGPVYLRSSEHKLPDLVASLRYEEVRIVVSGRIGPAKHGIRAFFGELPDAPLNRFTMVLDGGRRGLLVNSADICRAEPRASVKALAQNNLGRVFTTRLRGQCGKQGRAGKRRGGKRGKGGRR